MNFKLYLKILWEYKWVILATVLATLAITAFVTFSMKPTYTASTIIRIAGASTGEVSYTDYIYSDKLMNTYTYIATSSPVLTDLSNQLGLTTPPTVNVSVIPSTELMQISVQSGDAVTAQRAANTLADILITRSNSLYTGEGKSAQDTLKEQIDQVQAQLQQARLDYEAMQRALPTPAPTPQPLNPDDAAKLATQQEKVSALESNYSYLLNQYEQVRMFTMIRANTISVVQPAARPTGPSSPRRLFNLLIGLAAGLVGGLGLTFLFETLNPRLYTSDQIRSITDLNMIGKVPLAKNGLLSLKRGPARRISQPMFKESLRALRVSLMAQRQNGAGSAPVKNALITSAGQGEGKSIIAANLAQVMAHAGQSVMLIDADMRLPMQHKIFGMENTLGLGSLLAGEATLEEVIRCADTANLAVITSGPAPSDPVKLLASPAFRNLLDQLDQRYDFVLIDAPALLTVADAAAIAPQTDGVVLVVRRNVIREEAVREACDKLENMGAHTIGLVINEAEPDGSYSYYQSQAGK